MVAVGDWQAFRPMGDLLVASKPYVAAGGSMPMISEYRDEHFAGVEALWQEASPNDAAWNARKQSRSYAAAGVRWNRRQNYW
jgi:hypothetical protein